MRKILSIHRLIGPELDEQGWAGHPRISDPLLEVLLLRRYSTDAASSEDPTFVSSRDYVR